ncbi:MAG TPA: ABC transporter ATP-binding protein [Verrucomicrobiae bacterium]|nr:ABC transporter ATP-binding protein [Verrucomicrobiae bacterium]
MASSKPVLDVSDAVPLRNLDEPGMAPVSLRLMPGELALIETNDPRLAARFADLCCGMVKLAQGNVTFLGCDWTAMTHEYATALRGRIGRVFAEGGWIEFVDIATNIFLSQLHHTRRDLGDVREEAAKLACRFGLPGLPIGKPRDLSTLDLARSACIRAFLGEPALLLLESPLQGRFADLIVPLVEALTSARQNGAAAIWLSSSDLVWRDRSIPVKHRLRLREYGLIPARRAA